MACGELRYREAGGHLKLEGTFLDGGYDGTVTRFYPSGTRQSLRVNLSATTNKYITRDGIRIEIVERSNGFDPGKCETGATQHNGFAIRERAAD